jgi:hypothetical protein
VGVATLTRARRAGRTSWARSTRRALALALLLAAGVAAAATVTIDTGGDPEARLELRSVPLPDGSVRDLYVVAAERVTVRREELTIVASRLEFDPAAGRVRIVGRGRVERPDEVLVGDDLVVDLDDGRLEGRDVWVLTDRLNVFGARADRVDGRIRLLSGDIAPCGACGQEVEDYGFLAERIEILPGDRLIAWDVVLLLRERPFLPIPLLVLPLAEPNRLPRFTLERGGSDGRTTIAVDWPYVAGATAYGTLRARLRLDVDPATGGPVDGRLLGGRVEAVYPEGGFVHRFYDARGSGSVVVDARPAYADEERGRPWLRFEATYRSDPGATGPELELRLARDDERRPDLVEAEARLASDTGDVGDGPALRVELEHRLFVPLDPQAALVPGWDGPSTARQVPFRLQARTIGPPLRAGDGTLSLTAASLEAGVFDDQPNPVNRSALARDEPSAGRLAVRHRVELAPTRLGPFEIDGVNDFAGDYYTTDERQIDWEARLQARLPLGALGALRLTAARDAAEGETPFAFDRIRLRTRSELRATLDLRPFVGARLTGEAGYVLEDDRAVGDLGWTPTALRLTLFGTTRWADLSIEHRADPLRRDVGSVSLDASATTTSSAWRVGAEVAATVDLDPALAPDRFGTPARDTGAGEASLQAGLRDRLALRADAGYDVEATAGDDFAWRPVRLTATAGTLEDGDALPGLEAFWAFDPASGATDEAGYRAAIDVGPLRAEAEQRFGAAGGPPGTHRYTVVYRGVARASLEGPELLPSGWLGLEPDGTATRRTTVRLRDDGAEPGTRFEVVYRTDLVPLGEVQERRGTRLEATLRLAERRFAGGMVAAAVDGFAELALADDAQPSGYLRRASLTASLELATRLGVQGTVGYRGTYDLTTERVRSGRLSFEEVAVTVRVNEELYLGAALSDVWEVVEDDPAADLAFDPRPVLYATWDRCCWALYASWDTRDGELLVTLGAPASREGIQFGLGEGEGPTLPWRDANGADP